MHGAFQGIFIRLECAFIGRNSGKVSPCLLRTEGWVRAFCLGDFIFVVVVFFWLPFCFFGGGGDLVFWVFFFFFSKELIYPSIYRKSFSSVISAEWRDLAESYWFTWDNCL